MKDKKLFTKGDLIAAAAVVIIALLLFIPSCLKKDRLVAEVYCDGKTVEVIDLTAVKEAYTFSPKNGAEITVENGRIRFSSAVCRDKLCVNSGWLNKNGQTAACLPERIVICVKGSGAAPDMLTY